MTSRYSRMSPGCSCGSNDRCKSAGAHLKSGRRGYIRPEVDVRILMVDRLAVLSARDANPLEHPACKARGRSPECYWEGQRLVHVLLGK